MVRFNRLLLIFLSFFISCPKILADDSHIKNNSSKAIYNLIHGAQYIEEMFNIDTITLKIPERFALSSVKNLYLTHDKRILITDRYSGHLLSFSSKGQFLGVIGRRGRGPGEYLQPWYFLADSEGKIAIADFGQFKITICDSAGNFIRSFPVHQLIYGMSIFFPQDYIIIHDHENARIEGRNSLYIYNEKGKLIRKFGKASEISRKLKKLPYMPPGPYITSISNYIFVAEYPDFHIKKYNIDGVLLKKFGVKPKHWKSLLSLDIKSLPSPQMVTPQVQKKLNNFFEKFGKYHIVNWITSFKPNIICIMIKPEAKSLGEDTYFLFYDTDGNLIRDDITFRHYPKKSESLQTEIIPIMQNGFCLVQMPIDFPEGPMNNEPYEQELKIILFNNFKTNLQVKKHPLR